MISKTLFRSTILSGCAALLLAAVACTASSDEPERRVIGTDAEGNPIYADAGGDGDGDGDGGGPLDVNIPVDTGDGPREAECTTDEAGVETCVCIKLATWGGLGTFGAVPGADGQDAITGWLNSNSTGEAEYFPTKAAIDAVAGGITPEFLAGYDVIILQDLNGWGLTGDEVANIEAWVRAGGGVISLQGYSDQGAEAVPTNQILAFSGMQYVGLTGPGDTHGDARATSGTCDYCLGKSSTQGGFTDHPIAANVTAVGAFWGRSVDPGMTGQVVAQEGNLILGAATDVDAGRVFMFHDEWVTYNSQWNGSTEGGSQDCRTFEPTHECGGVHPTVNYQIPQFWFNSIKWSSGDPACFDITDPAIIR